MSDKNYELRHGDGGHGGPYTLQEAIEAGRNLAINRVQLRGERVAREYVHDTRTDSRMPIKIITAHRLDCCSEVHVCVR